MQLKPLRWKKAACNRLQPIQPAAVEAICVSPLRVITGTRGLNFPLQGTACQESTVTWHHPSLLQMS